LSLERSQWRVTHEVGCSERTRMSDWYPVAWQRDDAIDAIRIERTVSPFYVGERFAVRRHSLCLATDGSWEYEPTPSSRDDAFYERCRFKTFDAAVSGARSVPE